VVARETKEKRVTDSQRLALFLKRHQNVTSTFGRVESRAAASLYDRLDEFGFDFTVLYPAAGLAVGYVGDLNCTGLERNTGSA
jgi:hypothetical protein